MMWSKRSSNELYVYRNGVLVYKKWYRPKQASMLFNREVGWPDQRVVL